MHISTKGRHLNVAFHFLYSFSLLWYDREGMILHWRYGFNSEGVLALSSLVIYQSSEIDLFDRACFVDFFIRYHDRFPRLGSGGRRWKWKEWMNEGFFMRYLLLVVMMVNGEWGVFLFLLAMRVCLLFNEFYVVASNTCGWCFWGGGFVTGRERGQRKRGDEELNLLPFNRHQVHRRMPRFFHTDSCTSFFYSI